MRYAGDNLIHLLERLRSRFGVSTGVAAVAFIAFVAFALSAVQDHKPFGSAYEISAVVPPEAPIVKRDGEVRLAGQRVGAIREVRPVPSGRLVTFTMINEAPVGRDATVRVRIRGFAGSGYLDVEPGDRSRPLPTGSTLPRSQTSTDEDLSDVATAFDKDARQGLARVMATYGGGLLGRGKDVNRLLADLGPFARESTPVLRALAGGTATGRLSGLLHELDRTSRGLSAPNTAELGPAVGAMRGFFDTTARQGEAVGALIDELRPFEDSALRTLPVTDPLLADTAAMAQRLAPATRQLAATLPQLNTLLDRGRALRASLTRFARAADPVLQQGRPLVAELRPAAAALAPVADPLKPFAAYMRPYRGDIVRAMELFNGWSGFRYGEGLAARRNQDKREYAIRFGPVFTCARARDPFPAPGATLNERKTCP